jgi:hypothetical protein
MSSAKANSFDLDSTDGFSYLLVNFTTAAKKRLSSVHLSLSTGRHFLGLQILTNLKTNLCRHVTKQNTKIKTSNSQAKETTALQPNIFLTGIHQLQLLYLCLILQANVTVKVRAVLVSRQQYLHILRTSE